MFKTMATGEAVRDGELTDLDFKKIIARRDTRYDGRFFFGVRTTRIYCRVSCPARPKPDNILIFRSPSEAERAGYRACLRCRPEAASTSSVYNGTGNTVARALRLIEASNDERVSIELLSRKLGVTDRHLRRLFDEHLGASPMEIIITRRLHMAMSLIRQTNRPLSEVALAVGFQSIRRFNDAFKRLFECAPSEFRKSRKSNQSASTADAIELTLAVLEPYDWKTVLSYLQRHEAFGIERVTDSTYSRYVPQPTKGSNAYGIIEVRRSRARSVLHVKLCGFSLGEVRFALHRLSQLFDTRHNPAHLAAGDGLKPGGIRVPGSYDGFETAISIILSQLVSTVQAKALLKKLILQYGRPLATEPKVWAFPSPNILSEAPLEALGMTRVKATAIRGLAKGVAAGEIDLSNSADIIAMRPRLLALTGVGPWTSEMIAMRCWSDPNAFPKSDLIVKRAFEAKLFLEDLWTPSRAYLAHCLWRDFSKLPTTKRIKT